MADKWQPEGASPEMEELMERHDLPEEDRDEVRRFAEFLQRRKDKKDGKELSPMDPAMKAWLIGESNG